MIFRTILAGIILAAAFGIQPAAAAVNPSAQDFFETAYGYKSKRAAKAKPSPLRDAPASKVTGGSERTFVRILPKSTDYRRLLEQISAGGNFVYGGEITVHAEGGSKQIYIFGWASAGSVAAIRANPGVAGVFEEAR